MSNIKKSELLDIVREQGSAITLLLQRVTLLEKPQLKTLDQSVFDGLDENWRFAMVSSVGIPFVYDYKPTGNRVFFSDDATQQKIKAEKVMRISDSGYDTADWQNSLIERDKAELTGSDLCRAMLARGDKIVLCIVKDNEFHDGYYDAITKVDSNGSFDSTLSYWQYAVPINNQGEPLTASEVGL